MLVEQKDKVERKLKKVKIGLMRNPKYALWSGVMMIGKTEIVDGMSTAATNGRDEFYGRAFIASLSEKELAFVILHVADSIDMHHQRDEGDDAHHHRGQAVDQKADFHLQTTHRHPRVNSFVEAGTVHNNSL